MVAQMPWHEAGRRTLAEGIEITWQTTPVVNDRLIGAMPDGVIRAAIFRLQDYQAGPLACDENRQAIAHLVAAIACLEQRTRDRYRRGVLGSDQP